MKSQSAFGGHEEKKFIFVTLSLFDDIKITIYTCSANVNSKS